MINITHKQRGSAIMVVLVMLSVMLLGGLALARLSEVSTLVSGNSSYREAALLASEIGVSTAFQRLINEVNDANEDTSVPQWYWNSTQAVTANGIPNVDFDAAPNITVNNYTVSYIAERVCNVDTVTDRLQQCLVRQTTPGMQSADAMKEALLPQMTQQFRITVRVTGPKNTQVWVQSLVTKGSG